MDTQSPLTPAEQAYHDWRTSHAHNSWLVSPEAKTAWFDGYDAALDYADAAIGRIKELERQLDVVLQRVSSQRATLEQIAKYDAMAVGPALRIAREALGAA